MLEVPGKPGRFNWCYLRVVTLNFIWPGKPTENVFIDLFNGRLRDECLNVNEFARPDQVREALGHGGITIITSGHRAR